MATLSSVLKGPAKSWWTAEKATIRTWGDFKPAFLKAFLASDFQFEIEERLRNRIQAPAESIRDFAYDYRALCLKWKPEMGESLIVQRILNNANPKVAAGMRGTVKTVADLVRVGSMVESDMASMKKYWTRVNSAKDTKAAANPFKKVELKMVKADRCPVQTTPLTLLAVHLAIRRFEGPALLDTGSTFSLIRHELWKKIQRPKENLTPGGGQEFALANGVSKEALGKFHCVLSLQGDLWTHTLHVLADSDLAFPVILGLDFMQKTNMQIDFKNKLYGIQDRQAYHPFLNQDGLGSQWQSVF